MKKLKYLFMMLVLTMAIIVMSGCGDDEERSERKEQKGQETTVRLGEVIGYVEKSCHAKDMQALDSLKTAMMTYICEPDSEYDDLTVYTLTELLEMDTANVIRYILADTFEIEGDFGEFNASSIAFEDITSDDVLIYFDNGSVSIFAPSKTEENDKYCSYETGRYVDMLRDYR